MACGFPDICALVSPPRPLGPEIPLAPPARLPPGQGTPGQPQPLSLSMSTPTGFQRPWLRPWVCLCGYCPDLGFLCSPPRCCTSPLPGRLLLASLHNAARILVLDRGHSRRSSAPTLRPGLTGILGFCCPVAEDLALPTLPTACPGVLSTCETILKHPPASVSTPLKVLAGS